LREWLATVGHGSAAIEGSSLVTSRHECMCCHERICDFAFEHGAAMNVVAMTKVQTVSGGSRSVPVSCRHEIRKSRECEWCCNGGSGSVLNKDNGDAKMLATAGLPSNLGAAMVGLDVCAKMVQPW